MFCKHCGKELNNDSKFCTSCGAQLEAGTNPVNTTNNRSVSSSNMGRNNMALNNSNLGIERLKFFGVNIVLIIVYFMGWLKVEDSIDFSDAFSDILGISNSISPKQIFDGFRYLKDKEGILSLFGADIPIYYNAIYLLILIPILSGIAIVLCFINMDVISIKLNTIASLITILASIFAIFLTFDEYIGFKIGLVIALVVSIFSFKISSGLKKVLNA